MQTADVPIVATWGSKQKTRENNPMHSTNQ
ncbi:hypothetical protein ABIE71_005484 [Bradyrhizobium diazoefficiens]